MEGTGVDENQKLRIADDQVRGGLADAQEWTCGTCGAELVAGAAAIVYASPSDGGPADPAPVLAHESCADEQRASFPDWGDAQATLCRAGDPAAAKRALEAAVARHRDGIGALVEQAVRPLRAKIAGLETQNRELETQKVQLEQSVGKLRKMQQDLLSKNHKWSEAFKREKALRQELEQRIARFVQAVNGPRFLTQMGIRDAIAAHLQPQKEQA